MNIRNAALCTALGLTLTSGLYAHSRWIVPSHTIFSGKEAESVAFDISVSNEIFHADRPYGGKSLEVKDEKDKKPAGPPRPEVSLQAILPDGKVVKDIPVAQVGRKSVASYSLDQTGTYRFSMVSAPGKMTFFDGADGKPGRQFGEYFDAKGLPAGAKNIRHVLNTSRVETFVSRNGQSPNALKPMTEGLDLSITPQPNDLFVGETSEIQVYVNGKPAGKDIKLTLTEDGTRYRNERGTVTLTTDAKGKVSHKWAKAGLYLIEIENATLPTGKNTVEERQSLFLTLEVNAS